MSTEARPVENQQCKLRFAGPASRNSGRLPGLEPQKTHTRTNRLDCIVGATGGRSMLVFGEGDGEIFGEGDGETCGLNKVDEVIDTRGARDGARGSSAGTAAAVVSGIGGVYERRVGRQTRRWPHEWTRRKSACRG